ncbi:uncharacterized protein LOC143018505 [Oratosquilla oratoria]|uniref:uncharacterized protein LOC143018505 n=1 Tax=Oratosquilla oratoria TaxID=337810 RepID=UPI003F75C6CA
MCAYRMGMCQRTRCACIVPFYEGKRVMQQQQQEKVQKRACRTILGNDYTTYWHALTTLGLPTLADRYLQTLRFFVVTLVKHPRHWDLLPSPSATTTVRGAAPQYCQADQSTHRPA